MGRTISIRFKNNRVSKVSGARNETERANAEAFGNLFASLSPGGGKSTAPTAAEADAQAEDIREHMPDIEAQ